MKKPHIKAPTTVSEKINTPKKRMVFIGLLIVAGFFIIAVVGATVQFVRNKNASKEVQSTSEVASGIINNNAYTPQDKADRLNNIGEYQQSIAYLQQQIDKATTPAEKAAFYRTASNVSISSKKYSEALKYAQEAEKLVQDASSAAAIGLAYRALGDNKNAAIYFGKAADRSPKDPGNGRSDYANFIELQKSMESQK